MKKSTIILSRVILAFLGVAAGYFVGAANSGSQNPQAEVMPEVSKTTPRKPLTWDDAAAMAPRAREVARFALASDLPFEEIESRLGELKLPFDIELAERLLKRLAEQDGRAALELFETLPIPENFTRLTNPSTLR